MTDLVTKTAQSLHAEWCRQMRKKGFHGPKEECTYDVAPDNPLTYQHQREVRYSCKKEEGMKPNGDTFPYRCGYYHPHLLPWPDLDESRRQEYLATAKAVLPEIVEEVLKEAILASCEWCAAGEVPQWGSFPKIVEKPMLLIHQHEGQSDSYDLCDAEPVVSLRDRRLGELE